MIKHLLCTKQKVPEWPCQSISNSPNGYLPRHPQHLQSGPCKELSAESVPRPISVTTWLWSSRTQDGGSLTMIRSSKALLRSRHIGRDAIPFYFCTQNPPETWDHSALVRYHCVHLRLCLIADQFIALTGANRITQQLVRLQQANFKSTIGCLFVPAATRSYLKRLRPLIDALVGYLGPSGSPAAKILRPGDEIWRTPDFAEYFLGSRWFSMSLIILLCEMKADFIRSIDPDTTVKFLHELYTCNPTPKLTWTGIRKAYPPWPRLGSDASWRTRNIVSVVGTDTYHYATILILGPQRTTVIFDGYGGASDSPNIKKVPSILPWSLDNS